MITGGGSPARKTRLIEYLATSAEALILLASFVYVWLGTLASLLVWEVMTVGYLAAGFAVVWSDSKSGRRRWERRGALDALSWVLPLMASVVGVYSAILALIARTPASSAPDQQVFLAVAASVGVVLAWILMHLGFAQIYESGQARATRPSLEFPRQGTPVLADFLYFAFTIGTSFATSDASIIGPRLRLTVLVHSVVSFFYNALVVAVALQVLQQLVAS